MTASADAWPHDRRSLLEIAAVALTGVLHFVFEEGLHLKGPFIIAAVLAWTAYLVGTAVRRPGTLADWGFWPAPHRTWIRPGLVLLAGVVALVVAGAIRGTLSFPLHAFALLGLYPVWGVAQQFMLQAMVVRNLRGRLGSVGATTAVCAVLFGLIHWPDVFLMGATLVLALAFVPLYLRDRAIVPLGIVHGWLGVLAYYWLLGRDPFLELFG